MTQLNFVHFSCFGLNQLHESPSDDETLDTLTQSTVVQWGLELPEMTL